PQDVVLRPVERNHNRGPTYLLERRIRTLAVEKRPRVLHADDSDDRVETAVADGETSVHALTRDLQVLLQAALERQIGNVSGRDHDLLRLLVRKLEGANDDLG